MARVFSVMKQATSSKSRAPERPPSVVRPEAISVMRELDIDISQRRPKSVQEFDGQQFDCIVTVRYAAELGYEVTVVKDATASYSDEHMYAPLEVNIPNYATAIVATNEIVDAISSLGSLEVCPALICDVGMRLTADVSCPS
jgi:protein-tyrosine-phosphatase